MGRPCSTCKSEHKVEIEKKLRDGSTYRDVERWLHDLGPTHAACAISDVSLAKHSKEHMVAGSVRDHPAGRRPTNPDFLLAVVEDAHEGLRTGRVSASLRDGIAAQRALDERTARADDKQLVLVLAQVIGGGYTAPAIEGQFSEVPLLEDGSDGV